MTVPRVVIIGAGVVGAALADELSARGWTDITVLDQGPLYATGGSSSHAPGLVFQCNGSKTMTELARYTVEKLTALELDGAPCFMPVGGLEIATNEDRLEELHRRHGWLTCWGVESRVVSPEECVKLHSMLNPDLVLGGLHTPTDGLAVSLNAVAAQARAAQERGVRFLPYHEVLDVVTRGGRVTGVRTNRGQFLADVVVCCAGIWGPKLARMVGTPLPLTPLAHQLAWTTPVPELAGQTADAVRPIIRHQGHDLYYRERGDTFAVGWYGHRPLPITADDILRYDQAKIMPSMLEFTPEDFAPAWEESRRLFPGLADTEIAEGMNGLF
ncbi:MAG: NAD(P)/FAD-dependent oxidoreductase, partial [Micromonosporaceae bacterium]